MSMAVAACLAATIWSATEAQAAVVINFTQSGANVVANYSGSLDLTGLAAAGAGGGNAYVAGGNGEFSVGPASFVPNLDVYSGLVGPASFGTGGSLHDADAGSGTVIGVTGDLLLISGGYASGNPISGSSTWNSSTFSSLGLTEGSYVYAWDSDSITLNIVSVATAVPEPSSFVLAGLALGLVAFQRNARRRRSA